MINFKQALAALAVTLAVSAGIAKLCTGRRPQNQLRTRAGHSPVQPVGGAISAVPLG
jgi:hypothetical protein